MLSKKAIKKIEQQGHVDLRRIQPERYGEQNAIFHATHSYGLPPKKMLTLFGDPSELKLLLTPLTITITFADSSWVQYMFKPGFFFDEGSVPPALRSIVDNDELAMTMAAFPHDANFACHFFSFSETNSLFYRMLRYYGMGSLKAFLARLAVSSIAGKARWNKGRERAAWTARHCTVAISDRGRVL